MVDSATYLLKYLGVKEMGGDPIDGQNLLSLSISKFPKPKARL